MKHKPGGGNGSGKFEIGQRDMGGWARARGAVQYSAVRKS
jgi:hypothetical protein